MNPLIVSKNKVNMCHEPCCEVNLIKMAKIVITSTINFKKQGGKKTKISSKYFPLSTFLWRTIWL